MIEYHRDGSKNKEAEIGANGCDYKRSKRYLNTEGDWENGPQF
jgi:hypothetical protein